MVGSGGGQRRERVKLKLESRFLVCENEMVDGTVPRCTWGRWGDHFFRLNEKSTWDCSVLLGIWGLALCRAGLQGMGMIFTPMLYLV